MKKFFVLKTWRNKSAYSTVVFTSDDMKDASDFCAIMNRNAEPEDKYLLCTVATIQ